MNFNPAFVKIGITGGIGSGKTTVAKIIEQLGYPVFFSDQEAKKLMVSNEKIKTQVLALFGEQAYSNGSLNRDHLAQVVFNKPDLLNSLNQVIHPEVRNSFDNFCVHNEHKKLIFNEAAILFETGAYKSFNFTILVTANESLRVKRVCLRDNITENQVYERLKNQWKDEVKIPLADFVVFNNGEALQPQIEKIILQLYA